MGQIKNSKLINLFIVFLVVILISSSIANAGFFGNLFGGIFDSKLNLAGKAYSAQYDGLKEEEITCYFEGSDIEHSCYSRKGNCTGIGECTAHVIGKENERLTWQNTCCDEYAYTIIDGLDKEISFSCDAIIPETVNCIFNEADTERTCTSQYGSCTRAGSCDLVVEAPEGERILWRSDCGGLGYSTQDGIESNVEFDCGDTVREKVICMFESNSEELCSSEYGSCKGVNRCIADVIGDKGKRLRWDSSLGSKVSTLMDGRNEYADFKVSVTNIVTENITCEFEINEGDNGLYNCTSNFGGDGCGVISVSQDTIISCKTNVTGEIGATVIWESTMPNSIKKITEINDKAKVVTFSSSSEDCFNGEDDDYDGKVDCEVPRIDPDCVYVKNETAGIICSMPEGWIEYDCSDVDDGGIEIDNDGDGDANCFDSNCDDKPFCRDEVMELCLDGIDNDEDGFIDLADDKCIPGIKLNLNQGVPELILEVTGYNFNEDKVNISVVNSTGYEVYFEDDLNVGDDGSFEDEIEVSSSWNVGPHEVLIEGYPDLVEYFRVLGELPADPTFDFTPDKGYIGDSIDFKGSNFEPNTNYFITFEGPEIINILTTSNNNGFIDGTFGVPDLSDGVYLVSIQGFSSLSKEFTIISDNSEIIQETFTCQFEDWDNSNEMIYTCTGNPANYLDISYSCSDSKTCSGIMNGTVPLNYIWTGDVPDPLNLNVLTKFDGQINDTIRFESKRYTGGSWSCGDGYSVTASNPDPLTKVNWEANYISPSCEGHDGVISSSIILDLYELTENFAGNAFRSLFVDPRLTDQITCVFDKHDESMVTCYSDKGKCSGVKKCTFNATGEPDTSLIVKSSIVNSEPVSLLIDGEDDIALFSEQQEQITEIVHCIFNQEEDIMQTCYSKDNSAECSGTQRCITKISGYFGEPITWESTLDGSNILDTLIKGGEKYLEFVETSTSEIVIPFETEEIEILMPSENEVEIPVGGVEIEPSINPDTEVIILPHEWEEFDINHDEGVIVPPEQEEIDPDINPDINPGINPDINPEPQMITKLITCTFGEVSSPQPNGEDGKSSNPESFRCSYELTESEYPIINTEEVNLGTDAQQGSSEFQILSTSISTQNPTTCSATEYSSCSLSLTFNDGTNLNFNSDYGYSLSSQINFENNDNEEIIFESVVGEETFNYFSWECQDGYSATAKLNDIQYPLTRWNHESFRSCSAHGSVVKPSGNLESKHLTKHKITGNAIYQPNTYAGWVMFQLGLVG